MNGVSEVVPAQLGLVAVSENWNKPSVELVPAADYQKSVEGHRDL